MSTVKISDSGGREVSVTTDKALKVDGSGVTQPISLTAGNNVIGQVKLTDGTDIADVLDLANSNPIAVAIVDTNGDQIASFGGGVQYTEGDTDATITGTATMMEVAANTLQPIQGTVADGLLVNLGANNDVTVTGVSTAANQTTIIGHVDGIEGLLTTIDSDTGNISTKIDAIAGAVSGTEMQVDVLTMPTVTVNTHAVTATDLDIRNLVNTDVVTAELSAVDNAVLDAIAASVAAIDTDTSTIIGHVDGIETLIGTTNTTLTTIDGRVDGLEASNSAIQAAVELIDNAVSGAGFNITQLAGTNIDTNSGNKSTGTQRIILATDQVQLTTPLNVTLQAGATGGDTVFHLASAGSTNATNIKASAGKVTGWYIYNSNAAARKVAFHNTAGTPTAGASVYFSLMIPPSSGANVSFPVGLDFSTGIGITTVTGLADSDSAAVAANDLIINIYYK